MNSNKYASLLHRLSAYAIDGLIFIGLLKISMPMLEKVVLNYYPISMLISVIILNLLFAFRDINGQSIGKRIMKIKVISTNGQKLSIMQQFLRYLTLFIGPVDFWVYWGDNFKERLGDKISKTKVIQM